MTTMTKYARPAPWVGDTTGRHVTGLDTPRDTENPAWLDWHSFTDPNQRTMELLLDKLGKTRRPAKLSHFPCP